MSLLKSGFVVGFYTFISRIFGYLRDIVIASTLGIGFMADIYVVMFKLPNIFRRIFAEGGLNPAFIPQYSAMKQTDPEKVKLFANQVFSFLLFILIIFVFFLEIAMPVLMYFLAPGFSENPEKFALTISLSRITAPYLLFVSLTSLLTGMLNANGRFIEGAASPIFLNISMLLGILYLSKYTETPVHALAISIFFAGIFQLALLTRAALKKGIMPRLVRPRFSPEIKTLLKRMIPSVLGGSIVQINLWVDTIIATLLPAGTVSILYYADRLNQLPLGLIGVGIGTVILPSLSKHIKINEKKEANHLINRSLEIAMLLSLPCVVVLFVGANPLIKALFARGEFGIDATIKTAETLQAFAIGLPAFIATKIFSNIFFASQDTRTPVKFAIMCLVINIILNLCFMPFLAHIGVALATSLSAWINFVLLTREARRRDLFSFDYELMNRGLKIIFSSLFMSLILFLGIFKTSFLEIEKSLIPLLLLLGLSGAIYLISIWIIGGVDKQYIKTMRVKA